MYYLRRHRKRNNDDPSDPFNAAKKMRVQNLDLVIKQKNEEIQRLKRLVEQNNQKIGRQRKDIGRLKKRIKELEEEVNKLTKELTETREELRKVKEDVEALKGNIHILYIGEMCRRLQANFYRCVFPQMPINPFHSYKMTKIDNSIKKMKSGEEKNRARERWEQLKEKENPERFQDLIKELQELRNTSAHPEIKDEIGKECIAKAAEELNKQGLFGFLTLIDSDFEDVKELIKMYNRFNDYVKELKE